MVRGYEPTHSVSFEPQDDKYYVDIWEQPIHRWIIGAVYHWYDGVTLKIPGFMAFEAWKYKRDSKKENDSFIAVPWSCSQDIRCHWLQHKDRTTLALIEISEDDYERIKKRTF